MPGDVSISIIIPVYNAEAYIEQCINSLIEQTFSNFEIICVENGSSDKTVEILEGLANTDSRLQILQIPHLTAGDARNRGMDEAKGKYLLFLDADDFFEKEMLWNIFSLSERDNAQVCIFGAREYREGIEVDPCAWNFIRMEHVPDELPFSGKNNPYIFEISTAHPWNKLYRRDFVIESGVRYQSIKRCNDALFVYLTLTLAERITIDSHIYINYRQHGASLQAKNDESPLDWCEAYTEIRKKLVARGDYDALRIGFQNICLQVIWHNFNIMKTYEGYFALYTGLTDRYLKEFDFDNMGLNEIYDYNGDIYALLSAMKNTSPEKELWVMGHIMIESYKNLLCESANRVCDRDNELKQIQNSVSYRLGYAITYPSRLLLRLFRRNN